MSGLSTQLNTIGAVPGTSTVQKGERPQAPGAGGVSFRDQLNTLSNIGSLTNGPATSPTGALKFSNHAIDRMQARGIRFSPDEMARIQNAVTKAANKGSRDTLLITDAAAMIVSVKDKTVVTVMDKTQLKDNVFTNIDSTVMI
jgi:flagellar operon protein